MNKLRSSVAIVWLVLISHTFSLTAFGGGEPAPTFVVQISTAAGPLQVTQVTGVASSPAEAGEIQRFLNASIAAAQEANPEFHLEVVGLAEGEADRARLESLALALGDATPAIEVLPPSWFSQLKSRFRDWYASPGHAYRLSFAFTQFMVEGTASAATLTISERIPMEVAASMGVLLGSISSVFLYKSRSWRSFVGEAGWTRALLKLPKDATVSSWVENTEALAKWLIIDGSIVAIAMVAMSLLGMPANTPHGVLAGWAGVVAADLAAEFPWEMAIISHNKAARAGSSESAHSDIHFGSDKKTLALSTLGAILTAAQLAEVPFAHWAIGASAGLGLIVYGKTLGLPALLGRCKRWVLGAASGWFHRPRSVRP